jgi:hypothetical protein
MPTHAQLVLAPRSVQDDDIAYLRRSLQMPDLPYVDFSAQHERGQALVRWLLLRELAGMPASDAGPAAR